MNAAEVRDLVLMLPGVTEHDHFGKVAYRGTTVKGKASRIFATLWFEEQRAVLMLSTEQQAELSAMHPQVFLPVPNTWGDRGATFVELALVDKALFAHGLSLAMTQAGVGA